ncbi:M15 family metallopeptidase [Cellulomonas sp. ACRRI]|uniref:M15 family metallopeptidase n=1 Tax=Cellulomonas sp. ACRRI TaxID=2918188 RepID=UPI001EF35620|nr:M15 family metallopeptidase [Cellulomonas sp. ACRRI]MCG7288417.1 M15 family metallopeptidase [Cellulomonas sp. ACRRI]
MSLDGIASINQRIAAIQATIGTLAPTPTTTTSGAAFAQALAQAVGGSSGASDAATAGTSASAAADTARDADGVPVALAGYGNGRIPAEALHEVGSTGHRLWAPAADALERLIADAARDGVTVGITDSYRSYEAQVDVAARKGLYSQGGLAAVPGTSDHGWGMAADLKLDDAAQSWMRANGGRYGFVEDTPREPWHCEYRPLRAATSTCAS